MTALWRYFPDFLPFGDSLPFAPDLIERINRDTNAEPWFSHAFNNRASRRHVCLACRWLARTLPRNAHIFEPGCGAGTNLFWLALQGFQVSGSDIMPEALEMCRRIARYANIDLDIWQDDGVSPQKLPQPVDALLSVNWLYHLPNTSMEHFLEVWRPALKPQGYIACDAPDISYNSVPGNQYHSSDRHLPEAQRRPSEYRFRLSADDMARIARQTGFRVLKHQVTRFMMPRRGVFLLQRID